MVHSTGAYVSVRPIQTLLGVTSAKMAADRFRWLSLSYFYWLLRCREQTIAFTALWFPVSSSDVIVLTSYGRRVSQRKSTMASASHGQTTGLYSVQAALCWSFSDDLHQYCISTIHKILISSIIELLWQILNSGGSSLLQLRLSAWASRVYRPTWYVVGD